MIFQHNPVCQQRIDEITAVIEQLNVWQSDVLDDIEFCGPSVQTADELDLIKQTRDNMSHFLNYYVVQTA